MTKDMDKVFLLGVGFQKCGTTWLHKYLRQFPEFAGGFKKEYHIWDALDLPVIRRKLVEKPSSFQRLFRTKGYLRHRMQFEESFYFDYFSSLYGDQHQISADISPSYSGLSQDRLEFIRQGFLEKGISCKAVALIRDPVSRIKSAVRFNLDRRNYNEGIPQGERDFTRALRHYFKSEHCSMRTRYDHTLERVRKVFPTEDVYVGIYETMFGEDEVARLSRFLGLEPNFEFTSVKVNKTKRKPESNSELEEEIRDYYSDVYDYCFAKFPATKTLWKN